MERITEPPSKVPRLPESMGTHALLSERDRLQTSIAEAQQFIADAMARVDRIEGVIIGRAVVKSVTTQVNINEGAQPCQSMIPVLM